MESCFPCGLLAAVYKKPQVEGVPVHSTACDRLSLSAYMYIGLTICRILKIIVEFGVKVVAHEFMAVATTPDVSQDHMQLCVECMRRSFLLLVCVALNLALCSSRQGWFLSRICGLN